MQSIRLYGTVLNNHVDDIDHYIFTDDLDYHMDDIKNSLTQSDDKINVNRIAIHKYVINDNDMYILCQLLEKNKYVNTLVFDTVKFGKNGIKYLCDLLKINNIIKFITLDKISLNNENCEYIGTSLKDTKSLKDLMLIHNKMTDIGFQYICDGIKKSRLRGLQISKYNSISIDGYTSLHNMLLANKYLKYLWLYKSNIDNICLKILCEPLITNTSLTELNLQNCKFGSNGCKIVCDMLKKNKSIKRIYLNDNLLNDCDCKIIKDMLYCNNNLKVLSLYDNHISDKGCKLICEGISYGNIHSLNFGRTFISDISCQYISKLISNNILQKLYLNDCNNIGLVGFTNITNALIMNNSVNTLSIVGIVKSLDHIVMLSNMLKNNEKLLRLNVNGCKNNYYVKSLFEALKYNRTLQEIFLYRSNIGNKGCKYIAKCIKVNRSLNRIYVFSFRTETIGHKKLIDALKINPSITELTINCEDYIRVHLDKFLERNNYNIYQKNITLRSLCYIVELVDN